MARSAWKGFAAGAIGGAVGTLVLNVFQKESLAGTKAVEDKVGYGHTYTKQQEELLQGFDKAHMQTVEVVAGAAGVRLSSAQKKNAVPVTEYAFGILCGGVYGLLAEFVPQATAGFGTTYGAVLFTGASEVVLPALGLVAPPQERTPIQHLGGLSGNVVYGAVTEGIRRLLRP